MTARGNLVGRFVGGVGREVGGVRAGMGIVGTDKFIGNVVKWRKEN